MKFNLVILAACFAGSSAIRVAESPFDIPQVSFDEAHPAQGTPITTEDIVNENPNLIPEDLKEDRSSETFLKKFSDRSKAYFDRVLTEKKFLKKNCKEYKNQYDRRQCEIKRGVWKMDKDIKYKQKVVDAQRKCENIEVPGLRDKCYNEKTSNLGYNPFFPTNDAERHFDGKIHL